MHEGEKQPVQDIFLRVVRAFVRQIQDEFKTCKNLAGRLFRSLRKAAAG